MSTASASDVTDLIDTQLSDSEINTVIDRASEKHSDANDTASLSTTVNKNVESYLAALMIVQQRDPAVGSEAIGDAQFTYDKDTVAWLQQELDYWDPSGELAGHVNTNRYVGST